MENIIDLCSSPEDISVPEQFWCLENNVDSVDVKVSTEKLDEKVYPLTLGRLNGQPSKRKRLSLSKPNKKVLNRSINDNGKSLKEDTTEQAVVLKSGLPHDSPPKSAAGLDAYVYAFDSEIKMAPSGVSESICFCKRLSWWACSNADKQKPTCPMK